MEQGRIFLLSPAKAGGPRYEMLLRDQSTFEAATRLKQGRATIGEVYTFISGLYFRGKMAYAEAFATPAFVIVPGLGLLPPSTRVSIEDLRAIAEVPVDAENEVHRDALLRGARSLDQPGQLCVLLGSIADDKYTSPLLEVFGERLVFPVDFVGRGNMSRGGLMLRCAGSGTELSYAPVEGTVRRGPRPPKLR